MIWGAISHDWKSELVFLISIGKSGITAQDYMERVLEPVVTPISCGLYDWDETAGGLFVEDQAPIHGTQRCLAQVKKQLCIPLHHRPPSSPDLNPIENVWRTMKQRIKARRAFPNNVARMKEAIQEEWDKLEPKDWNGLIDSMPERIQQLKERKGMQTQY